MTGYKPTKEEQEFIDQANRVSREWRENDSIPFVSDDLQQRMNDEAGYNLPDNWDDLTDEEKYGAAGIRRRRANRLSGIDLQ